MRYKQNLKGLALLSSLTLVVALLGMSRVRGRSGDDRDDSDDHDSRIQRGFEIVPPGVTLNLHHKNRALVGLGSYLVNGPGDCNACHNKGPGNNQFLPGGNPFFGQPKMVDPATYLGGGRDFGDFPPNSGTAHIISRNLTPDKTGRPEGGHTFEEFLLIIRTGVDMDNLHPTCPVGTVNPGCVPHPFDGSLLQVMPWPNLQNMTDHDLRAIYEYLSAIPCIDTIVPGQPQLRNDCQ